MITNAEIILLYGHQNTESIDGILNNSLFKEFANALNSSSDKHKAYLKAILNLTSAITDYQKSGQRHNLFPEYSKHEIEHSYCVMYYMHQLLGNREQVNCATYFYLIMVALCHDLGMTLIAAGDIDAIKDNNYWNEQKQKYNWYKVLKSVNNIEHNALSVIVRSSHHECEIVNKKVMYLFNKNNYDYSILNDAEWDLIFKGCCSHGISIDEIKEIINRMPQSTVNGILRNRENGKFDGVNFALVCSLLRICDLLDISYDRVGKYNTEESTNPYNLMNKFVESVVIKEDNRSTDNHCISGNTGECKCQRIEKYVKINFKESELKKIDDPNSDLDSRNLYESAYIMLLKYFVQIEEEIKNLKDLLDFETVAASYTENIRPHINERLQYGSEKYNYLKISIDEDGILNQIMSDKLYGSNDMAIRELLQNAIDACQAKALSRKGYIPIISLSYKNNILSIKDNGIGMTPSIIENFFLKAGKSLYKSNAYRYSNSQFFHAGQFGLGVFSAFMLTSQINVKTVPMKNTLQESCFTMKKNSRYARTETVHLQEAKESGTEIEFEIDENITLPDLESFIQRTFVKPDDIGLQILVNGKEVNLLTLPDIAKKQRYELNLNSDLSTKIDLSKYFENVSGFVYLEKCLCSFWLYNQGSSKFEKDCSPSVDTEVAVIEAADQTPGGCGNKIARFIVPWDEYYASTHQDLKFTETVSHLDTLMGKKFSELCKAADINERNVSIRRFKTVFRGITQENVGETFGNSCAVGKSKHFYLNNILITKHGDDFNIPLPMNLHYRVSSVVMNIINFDGEENKEIKLLLNRNGFTPDTYDLIRQALEYAIFKHLLGLQKESHEQFEGVDLNERISRLCAQNNFLIKQENA